jgi:hypothetical protein
VYTQALQETLRNQGVDLPHLHTAMMRAAG